MTICRQLNRTASSVCAITLAAAAAWCGPKQEATLIQNKMLEAGRQVMEHGNVDAFLAICAEDILFTVKETGEVHRLEGKPALRAFLFENAPPTVSGGRPPEIKTAIMGSEAASILDVTLPYREMGCVRAVLRWRKVEGEWLLREYTETDVEPGMLARPKEEWTWPAEAGVGLPVAEGLRHEIVELAAEAAEEVAVNPDVDWPNTRLVVIAPDGSGTVIAATVRTNNGPNRERSFIYNTSRQREERVYDSKGNKLAVRKWLRDRRSAGRYRVEVTFARPLAPGESETTFNVSKNDSLLSRRGEHWVFQWRNYPGSSCYDTCRVKFPPPFEVVEAFPEPTDDHREGDARCVTWHTVVPRGGNVSNVIVFRKPAE